MERVNKNYFLGLNLLMVITFIIDWSLAVEFDYKNVDSWPLKYPQCGGQRQSPVSIEYRDLDLISDLRFTKFTYDNGASDTNFSTINYNNKPLSAKLLNNGHTIKVQFVWDENQTPYFSGEVFGENEYVLDSMHFHWSRISSEGAEHIFFGYGGAMEMHLVHYNRNYGSVENALSYDDGLAVIGGIFDILQQRRRRDNDDDDYKNFIFASTHPSPAVSQILSNVGSVRTPGSSVDIEPFAISDVRPAQLSRTSYVTYLGSLTTPPCTENVLWLVAQYPYQITEEQLQFLQETVEFDNGDDHNNRPVQPLNERRAIILWGVLETID